MKVIKDGGGLIARLTEDLVFNVASSLTGAPNVTISSISVDNFPAKIKIVTRPKKDATPICYAR